MQRLTLFAISLPAGLAAGLAAWLLADGLSVRASTLDGIEDRLARITPPSARSVRGSDSGASLLLTSPLFALTTGPGAVRDPAVRLDGAAITPRRLAALVSIDTKPAEWLSVGETRNGVTLQAVTSSNATFESALGVKTLGLGEQAGATPSTSPAAAGATTPLVQDQIPPGFRSPPEPASAPRSN